MGRWKRIQGGAELFSWLGGKERKGSSIVFVKVLDGDYGSTVMKCFLHLLGALHWQGGLSLEDIKYPDFSTTQSDLCILCNCQNPNNFFSENKFIGDLKGIALNIQSNPAKDKS